MASDLKPSAARRAMLAEALWYANGPRIMGIVNATDDSFYAESRSMDNEACLLYTSPSPRD